MRGFAYAVAILAAFGIMIGIGMSPQQPANDVVEATSVASEAGTLTLDVPNMHCEFACFPRVKDAIEGGDAVEEVVLAEQQEEGTIDNRQVIVKYDAGFDIDSAIARLSKEGFTDAGIAQ